MGVHLCLWPSLAGLKLVPIMIGPGESLTRALCVTFSSLTCGEYLHLFHFGKILWIKQTGLHRPLLSPLIGKSYQWLLEWMTDGTKPVFNMLRNCWVYFPRKLMMAGIVVVLCTMSMQKHSSHFKGGNGWFILEPVWGTHIWFFQNIVSHHGRGYMRFY